MIATLEQALFANRRWVVVFFVVATCLMAWFASRLTIDAGFTKQIPLSHPYMDVFLEHREVFGGANQVVIAVMANDGDMFTEEFIDVLHQLTDAMFFLPGVDRTQVYSILTANVRFLEVVEDGIRGGNVLPADFEPSAKGFQQLRENILKAGVVGRLVANDFSGALVSAKLQEFNPGTGEKLNYIEVANQIEEMRNEAIAASDGKFSVHVIGFVKVVGDIASGVLDVIAFFCIAFGVVTVFVYLYMRSVRLTALLQACSLLAVLWQLGILNALGYGIDPMSILIPFLIFAIAVSHGIQVINAARSECGENIRKSDAARAGFSRIVRPGLAALASDCIGFVTIALIDVQVIQEVAVAASIGVAGIILTNLLLLPVLLSYTLPQRHPKHALGTGRRNFLFPVWMTVSRVTRPKTAAIVIAVSSVFAIGGLSFASKVRIGDEHSGVPELRPESRYNTDAAVISENFNIGVDVFIVIAEAFPEACIDYEALRTIDEFEWHMLNVEGVQSVAGLAGTARRLSEAWNEGNLKWRTLPRNHYQLVQAVSPVPTSSGLLNSDCSIMPIHVYTADHKADTIDSVVSAVNDFNAANPESRVTFAMASGNVGVMAAANEQVKAAQFPILGYVFLAVFLLCSISFRSLTAVACVVVPLAVVSLLAYALMAILEIGLKISTLPVVALGIGVGVDYGIYIYGRVQNHLAEGLDFAEAYRKTLLTVGSGVVLTGLTLAASVATWLAASLQFQADMGAILIFMFVVNMIGAILLLPALAVWLGKINSLAFGKRS